MRRFRDWYQVRYPDTADLWLQAFAFVVITLPTVALVLAAVVVDALG